MTQDAPGYPTVVPYLLYTDVAAALAWLERAFGLRERLRCTVADPEGHQWTFSQPLRDVPPRKWGAVTP